MIDWTKDIEFVVYPNVAYPAKIVGTAIDNTKIILGMREDGKSFYGTFADDGVQVDENYRRLESVDYAFVRNKKRKIWINLYFDDETKLTVNGFVYDNKSITDELASPDRIACVEIEI